MRSWAALGSPTPYKDLSNNARLHAAACISSLLWISPGLANTTDPCRRYRTDARSFSRSSVCVRPTQVEGLVGRFYSNEQDVPTKVFAGGRGLDLRTLAFALTDRGYSLETACAAFGVEHGKQVTEIHGVVTEEYINYNRRDVLATAELVRCPGDFVRANSSSGIGVSPAEWLG